jgi:adenylosuccinate synthase
VSRFGTFRIKISDRAHLVFDFHQELDGKLEDEAKRGTKDLSIGTTKKGIGPCYTAKVRALALSIRGSCDHSR